MSVEEIQFAEKFKDRDIENYEEIYDAFDSMDVNKYDSFDNDSAEKEVNNIDIFAESQTVPKNLSCCSCGIELCANVLEALMTAVSIKNDEDDEMWKQFQQAQKEGLNIEYRCPRCRNCSDCRRSFETERVSLREEAEDLMI